MGKFFKIFGIVAAIFVLIVGGGIFFLAITGGALDKESKAYVDDAVISIAAHWDKAELTRRAAPQLLTSAKPEDLDNLFDAASVGLGSLVEYRGSQGQSSVVYTTGNGKVVSANYTSSAHFQKGDAAIAVSLIKVDEGWKIIGFHVNSNAMLANLAGKKT